MAKAAQIICINKDPRLDPYHAITHVGVLVDGSRYHMTLGEAVDFAKGGIYRFYAAPVGQPSVWVEVARSRFGNDYLKTVADNDEPNNLLSLNECRL